MLCSVHKFLLIALLVYTTDALKSCETFTIDIDGVEERRIGETNTKNCSLFKDLSNKCRTVSIDIVLDKNVSKFYHTNYGVQFDTIQTNVTFYNESVTSSAVAQGATTGDSKVPIIVLGVLGAVVVSGAIIYLTTHVIQTILQSGTYRLPDPS